MNATKQSLQREKLISAMLQNPCLEKAAKSIGISATTAWRISKTPEFQQEYHQARHDAFSQSQRALQEASHEAVTTLLKIMNDPKMPAACRLRAAERVIEAGERSFEREDLENRLRQLEEWASQRNLQGNGNGPVSNS